MNSPISLDVTERSVILKRLRKPWASWKRSTTIHFKFSTTSVKDANLQWLQVKYLCAQQLKPFPSKISECEIQVRMPMKSTFRIYCTCRLSDSGDKMVQCTLCHAWFHYTCGPPNWKKKANWLCGKCDNYTGLNVLQFIFCLSCYTCIHSILQAPTRCFATVSCHGAIGDQDWTTPLLIITPGAQSAFCPIYSRFLTHHFRDTYLAAWFRQML